MAVEPPDKRAIAFVDGQNLFHSVRESFGYHYPNYDIQCLAESICRGIDVRVALDVIALAHRRTYDVAVIFSQDQDLSEVAEEVRTIAQEQNRWVKVACAFPISPTTRNRRGIHRRIGSGSTEPLMMLAWIAATTVQRVLPQWRRALRNSKFQTRSN